MYAFERLVPVPAQKIQGSPFTRQGWPSRAKNVPEARKWLTSKVDFP
jgi:hypothetical protein